MSRLLKLAGLGLVAVIGLWILLEIVGMVLGLVWWVANVVVSLVILAVIAYLAYFAYTRLSGGDGGRTSTTGTKGRSREDDRERLFE